MGWANCGTDSRGRPIGYAHAAKCDHEGCRNPIDRGLAHACGGMHGENDGVDCEGYYCSRHLVTRWHPVEARYCSFCEACAAFLDWLDGHPGGDYSEYLKEFPERERAIK